MKCRCIKEIKFRIPIWFKVGRDYEFKQRNGTRYGVFDHGFGKSMGFEKSEFEEHFSIAAIREEKLDKILS